MTKAQRFLQSFMMHRSVLPELVSKLSDKDLTYTPWEGALSTRDLVWHMLTSSYGFTKAAATGTFERSREKPDFQNVEDLQKAVQEFTDKTVALIDSMPDERVDAMVDMTAIFGTEVSAGTLLQTMRDHEIHHKGQLFTYARLVGVDSVPMFIKRG